MKIPVFHGKSTAGAYIKYSLWLLTVAAFGLIIIGCSSEEERSRQAGGQSSGQKQADQIKPEIPDQTEAVQSRIKAAMDQVRNSKELKIGDTWLAQVSILPEFYQSRQFRPAWTKPANIKDLMQSIDKVGEDGLVPDDYHRRQLQTLSEQIRTQAPPDPQLLASQDLLLTDALILMGYHLQIGKVDPVRLNPNWNISAKIGAGDPVSRIQQAIDSGSIYQFISDLRPRDEYYNYLKAALSQYRSIHNGGSWQPIPQGPTLKTGTADERVEILRRRLTATGDLVSTPAGATTIFDEDLAEAVKHFQRRRGLKPDGIVGKNTIKTLNVPDKEIIDQIRINLERVRWVMNEDLDEFIFVNIPDFRMYYVRDEKIKWSTRTQVGRPFRQTPVFKAKMTYLVFNPTWTIPSTILKEDTLPAVKRDPNYLSQHNIQVIDNKGNVIDDKSIDWSQYSAKNFPYQLRQKPGPDNALGRVKFMFPNKHAVYLHDTPSKSLFGEESRAFSSGCIRIENPYDLGVLLLDNDQWDKDRILETVDTAKTTTVSLNRPVTVILLYWTVNTTRDGDVIFKNDIYDRDAALLAALKRPFRFRKSPVLKQ